MVQLLIDNVLFSPPQGLIVDESNPYYFVDISGGIKVDWGELGTDIIDGSNHSRSSTIAWKSIKVFDKPAPQDYGTSNGAYTFYPIAGKDLWGCWEYGGGNFYPFLSVSTQPIGVVYYYDRGQGSVYMYYLSGQGLAGSNPDTVGVSIRERGTEITITSNTGAKSSRLTQIDPLISILTGKCGVVVRYTDGSESPVMEFPECPIVQILPDCNCVCPSTLQLADRAISILGSF